MQMVDPNIYALSIQLQLESQDAFSTLDDFSESVTSLEEKVSAAAGQALREIGTISGQVETSVSNILSLFDTMGGNVTSITTSLGDAYRSINDTQKITEEDLEKLQKKRDLWEEIVDFHDDIAVSLKDHLKHHTKDIKLLDNIHAAITKKNLGHKAENDYIKEEGGLIQHAVNQTRHQQREVHDLGLMWYKVSGAVLGLAYIIAKIDADTEKFVQTNYRAYGSQQLLVQSTRSLSAELGTSREVALETYKALADVRTPRDELFKYAEVVSMANRTTGVSVQMLANYTKNLRLVGIELGQTEKHIVFLTEAMRKFGLTQDDVNRIMSTSSAEMLNFRRILGGNAEEVQKFKETIAVFAGLAKQMGASTEAAQTLERHLSDPIHWKVLGGMTGVAIKNTDDLRVALMKGGGQLSRLNDQIKAAAARGEDVTGLNIQFKVLSERMFGSAEAGEVAAGMYEKVSKELKRTGQSAEDFAAISEQLANIQSDQLAEANDTLTAQLGILGSRLNSIVGGVGQLIADGLRDWVRIINLVLYPIAKLVDFLVWIIQLAEDVPVLGLFVRFIKMAVAALVLLGVAFFIVSSAGTLFTSMMNSAGFAATSVINVVSSAGQAIVALARAFGQSIVIILQSLGQGLAALGRSVQPVMVPLLALGLALVLVAAASWVFAQAVKVIAEVGWAAVPAMLGLVIAIGLLGLVLVGLGMLAQGPVAVGILVVAGALFLVGAAAMMTGLGLKWAGEGLASMAEAISANMIMQIPMLAMSLIYLGAASLIAAPGLFVLGAALFFLSIGASAMSSVFTTMTTALESLSSGNLLQVATEFYQASTLLITASVLAAAAGVALIFAVSVLTPAAVALGGITLILGLTAPAFYAAATMLSSGATLLHTASTLLPAIGSNMLVSSSQIAMGSSALVSAMVSLGFVATVMGPIGMSLTAGAAMMTIGLTLMMPIAAMMLFVGTSIIGSSYYLDQAGVLLQTAGPKLISGSQSVMTASKWLSKASFAMFNAGVMMYPGAYMVYTALAWLDLAVNKFSKSIDQVKIVADSMHKLSIGFLSMQSISSTNFKQAVFDAYNALPYLSKFVTGLGAMSGEIDSAITKFEGPANRLAMILDSLASSITHFGEGLNLEEDVGKLAVMLDKYATLLEGASERITTAIETKAIPAIRAAEQAGLKEAIRSEAITTVQVTHEEEGSVDNQNELVLLATQQLETLKGLTDLISTIPAAGGSQLAEILALLQMHLPNMTRRDAGLSTEFNAWGR